MLLSISKGEAKGLFGGVKFTISAIVKLSHEESALIQRFKLEKEAIVMRESKSILSKEMVEKPIIIGDLVNGITFKCATVNDVVTSEYHIRENCKRFKEYLMALTGFDNPTVEEF